MKSNIELGKMFIRLADYDDQHNIPYDQFVKDVAKEVLRITPPMVTLNAHNVVPGQVIVTARSELHKVKTKPTRGRPKKVKTASE